MKIYPRTRPRQARGIGTGPSKGFTDSGSHKSTISPSSAASITTRRTSPATTTTSICDSHNAPQTTLLASKASSEDIIPEIIVRIDDMDFIDVDMDSSESEDSHQGSPAPADDEQPQTKLEPPNHTTEESRTPFTSSLSALTDVSDLSSMRSSVSSKATTPVDLQHSKEITPPSVAVPAAPVETPAATAAATPVNLTPAPVTPVAPASAPPSASPSRSAITKRPSPRRRYNVRPKVSMPPDMAPQEYAMQCIAAAECSRLNPYALHQEEYLMLRSHLSHAQVTTYLNIRNGILRMWMKNPQITVARDEAIGCAKDCRWFDVASVCYDWLVRRGYINFGCVKVKAPKRPASEEGVTGKKRRTVAVIGAGMSGLGCARQLDCLFKQYARSFRELGEEPPEVVVLEGRSRVGGRVYSRAFQNKPAKPTPGFESIRSTAEMGGMIITGFDRGNPMNILVRGQLCLGYHALRSDTMIYDVSGKAVNQYKDQLCEKLYNDCLDRVSEFKFKPPPSKLIEGNRDLMDEGKDSLAEGQKTIAFVEETAAAQPHARPVDEQNIGPPVNLVPVSSDRLTGRTHFEPGTPGTHKAAYKARLMGWPLKIGVSEEKDIELESATKRTDATLGSVMDEAIQQYKGVLDLEAQDFRLLNWHIANLEYSNAVNLNQLSLECWDIDNGNEWEGKHTMVVGGYQSVPKGLMLCPTPLDVQRQRAVKKICYTEEGSAQKAMIECEDGHTVEADFVVCTTPLGVLKHGDIEFQPPLPPWKANTITQLGFGVLNKVIMVFERAFWDEDSHIFGVLRTPPDMSCVDQRRYSSQRGRMFQWFNVSNTTGQPCLIALMAGDAALDTEHASNNYLVREATNVLKNVFGPHIPEPLESVVTRWASDKFARGSYSSAGPQMKPDDYDIMALPVGNLYFAGEHTIGSHPATVHGAYLSGLRAASEVLDAMLGPIDIPHPLILPKESSFSLKRKALEESKDPRQTRLEAYELSIWTHIRTQLGDRPYRPGRFATNAYTLFNKANIDLARRKCEEGRRPGKGKPSANELRGMTGKMWKDAGAEARRPFEEQAEEMRAAHDAAVKEFEVRVARWDQMALELRAKYESEHPSVPTAEEVAWVEAGMQGRRAKKVESYAEDESDTDV